MQILTAICDECAKTPPVAVLLDARGLDAYYCADCLREALEALGEAEK